MNSDVQLDEVAKGRLRWRCRRGMLELDLLFEDFVKSHFDTLTPQQMQALDSLLDMPDQQLWQLVIQTEDEMDASRQQVLQKLRGEQ
jgi:antitoxin CptB